MKDKGLYIIIAALFFSPLALLFYIEWYWVFLIYNVFWAAASYGAHSETKNPKISARNAFLIPLVFNLIGFGYVAMKLNDDDDDETVEPKSNDEVEAAKSRLRENILGTSKIEGYPDWVDVYRGDKGFNIELKKAIQKNVNENQSELINRIEKNNIIDSDNFWSHIEQSEILESFGLNKLFEDFSSEEYLKYAKNDEEAIEIEEKWQDEEYWIEMEFDAITIIDSKINELILNTQKFSEFKNTVNNLLDSDEDVSIYFYIYKWDTIEKQETYDEDWKGIKYKGYWDMILKNAVMELDEIKELYEIIKVNKTLDQLRGDDFNLFFSEDDGGNRENIKIDWERSLTDEEKKSFEEYGGIEQLAQDSRKYDNEDVSIGRISRIEIIIGDKKYSTEGEEETKDEILNTKLKERKILSHEIMSKGVFMFENKKGEYLEVFGQRHTLVSEIQTWDEENEEWDEGDREEIDDFHLTDYEKGYQFSEDDLCKFFEIDDWPSWDYNGFSKDWCLIEDDDDNETRQKKWDDYKAKFPKVTSIEHFDIENKKS
ncbi:hypothetical protein N8769_04350 [Flavobacteriaceae bacterium]|nr:hypothetical protein [Flavobacteriaceae bacterium]